MSSFYDILLDEDGDLPVFTTHTKGALVIIQRVKTRLSTFLGEWLLDTTQGLPFFQWMQQKNPNIELIGLRVRQEIESTPGVVAITRFQPTFDRDARKFSFNVDLEIEDSEETFNLEVYPGGISNLNSTPAVYFAGSSRTVVR